MKKTDRFICVERHVGPTGAELWVDTKTGVNYLFIREGFAGGLCPLLDPEGKPIITPEYMQS